MIDQLVEFLAELPPELITLIIGALPVAELRGAIPTGVVVLDLSIPQAFFWAYWGNLIPVIPLLLFLQPVSKWLRRFSLWRWFFFWLFARTKKRARIVKKYKGIGLALFVMVPLPVTGAWTGCAAATLFQFRFWPAFLAIAAGVLAGGVIVSFMVHFGLSLA
jgi:uncharacterized membrane protein